MEKKDIIEMQRKAFKEGCVHFQNEDAEGKGICDVTDKCRSCDYTCGKCKKKD